MSLPHAPGNETSREAARSMEDVAGGVAYRIWQFIIAQGPEGVIEDEVTRAFHESGSELNRSTVTARMRALKYSRLIVKHPDGKTRLTRSGRKAAVFLAMPHLNFHALFRSPPPHDREAERELLEAARAWTEDPGQEGALEALLNAAWTTFGEGSRPTPDWVWI